MNNSILTFDLMSESQPQLTNEQQNAVNMLLDRKRTLIKADVGAGKTVVTLTALAQIAKKTLIVAPVKVAHSVWQEEASKWHHLKHLRFSKVLGTPLQRERALKVDADIYVTSKDLLRKLPRGLGFKVFVIDESTCVKSHSSKIFKRARDLAEAAQYVFLLAAEPAPQGIQDLWSQFYLLDRGATLGVNITAFRQTYMRPHPYVQYAYLPKANSTAHVRDVIKSTVVRFNAPEKIETYLDTIPVELSSKAQRIYRQYSTMKVLKRGEQVSEAVHAADLANKLRQICNGFLYDTDGNAIHIHDEKIDALEELIERHPNTNFLVAYHFTYDLKRLEDRLGAVKLTEDNISTWNMGKIRILAAHPLSCAHGLNLQWGGSVVVWFGLPWSYEQYLQMNGRLTRKGQTERVRIIHLITNDTIESRLVRVLESKKAVSGALFTYGVLNGLM